MVKSFVLDTPSKELSLDDLKKIGVLYWNLDADNYEEEGKLSKICEERGYTYKDVVEVSPNTLPNYEEKIKIFFQEHLHTDEEIRFFLDGSGYFDVRGLDDEWIRIHCEKGEMIILPAGMYHRYSNDSNNYAKVMRLFVGEPVWTPYNRGSDSDVMECRKIYRSTLSPSYRESTEKRKLENLVESSEKRTKTETEIETLRTIKKVLVESPDDFDNKLEIFKGKSERLFLWFTGTPDSDGKSWCPDCVAAEPCVFSRLDKLESGILLECRVDRDKYKGNPDFAYRTDPRIKLAAIPTLIEWGKKGPIKTLVEGQCADEDLVAEFFES
eukprot:TRINITY_DN4510_c0_g1_i1.p1 TRINITY_DN4510_c0_g1~~TRINITY_DN4510_c0_g1_i1.p1  ORF type:complete len:326 (+),score=63.15 TRINITY_DN4510_c0_g1_i1:78-1055(+)